MRFFKFSRDENLNYYIQADKIELIEASSATAVEVYGSFTNDDLAMDRVSIGVTSGKAQETADLLAEYVSEERGTPIVTVDDTSFIHITGLSLDVQ